MQHFRIRSMSNLYQSKNLCYLGIHLLCLCLSLCLALSYLLARSFSFSLECPHSEMTIMCILFHKIPRHWNTGCSNSLQKKTLTFTLHTVSIILSHFWLHLSVIASHSLTHSLSPTHSFTRSLTHSLTYPFTHSLTLTHPLTLTLSLPPISLTHSYHQHSLECCHVEMTTLYILCCFSRSTAHHACHTLAVAVQERLLTWRDLIPSNMCWGL